MSDNPDERYWLAGGNKPVLSITRAAYKFGHEHSRLLDFVVFSHQSFASFFDADKSEEHPDRTFYERAFDDTLLQELILTRAVDNFLCFLSDLLGLIYKAKPEMLLSSEQERLDFVLNFSDMDQLRRAIAEKKVERLSYLGLKELAHHFEKTMGFKLFENPNELERAAIIVEMRNICVHARGIIGQVSVNRFPSLKEGLGKKLDLNDALIRDLRHFLEHCVFDIDSRASQKFGLECAKLPTPPPGL